MTIILIGYMGSGKSTVGKSLARILGYEFIDLDAYIETKTRMSVEEIFKKKGELFFRKVESATLAEVLKKQNSVIALGGGTPCYGNNLSLITSEAHVVSIYLKASISELVSRLFDERHIRPLIAHMDNKDHLSEFIGKHLFERAPFYESAMITVQTDHKPINDITEDIILELF